MEGNLTNQPDKKIEMIDMLPRFQLAKGRLLRLQIFTQFGIYLSAIFFVISIIIYYFAEHSLWIPLLCNNAAALLLLAMVTKLAYQIDNWRSCKLDKFAASSSQAPAPDITNIEPTTKKKDDSIGLIKVKITNFIEIDSVWVLLLSSIVLLQVYFGWDVNLTAISASKLSYVLAIFLTICIFGLLVVERYLFSISNQQWPEAVIIGFMVRFVIAVQLISVVMLFMLNENRAWPLYAIFLTAFLPAIVAVELMVRAIIACFISQRVLSEQSLTGKSLFVNLLSWPPKPLKLFQHELYHHFGIDLQQVWAFSFLKRAFFPIFIFVLLIGWLLSGLIMISFNERGIYEKFGEPVKVLKSGIHVGLPWPFGNVIAVEYGTIHEISTSEESKEKTNRAFNSNDIEKKKSLQRNGYALASANRLWDSTHRNEKSQIIASKINQKQSFHILNMDVKVIYRIGLSDQQALNATYNNRDIQSLIRSLLERILVHDFSSRTLDDALVEQRDKLSSDIIQLLQKNLDELSSGIEILAVIIEAIHPPAGAANAYHAVQAAQITTQVAIAQEKGKASAQKSDARINALELTNRTTAQTKEAISKAKADLIKFNSERLAWKKAGSAFLIEYYFNELNQTVSKIKPSIFIIDRHLKMNNSPTIDLRSYRFLTELLSNQTSKVNKNGDVSTNTKEE